MKKFISINVIVFISFLLLFFVGMAIVVFYSLDSEPVINGKVVSVQDNIIKVEAGTKNGDPVIYEIEKPFYKKFKSGDDISIRKKDGVVKYAINRGLLHRIGIRLIMISVVSLYIYIAYIVITAIILIKRNEKKKRLKLT